MAQVSDEGDDDQSRRRFHSAERDGAVSDSAESDSVESEQPVAAAFDDALLTAAPTALPSVLARGAAFVAIVIAAVCGGLAGYATGSLQCSAGCVGPSLAGAAIGALAAAAGVSALAALVLRSMSEWADQASVEQRRRGARRGRGRDAARSRSPNGHSPGKVGRQ